MPKSKFVDALSEFKYFNYGTKSCSLVVCQTSPVFYGTPCTHMRHIDSLRGVGARQTQSGTHLKFLLGMKTHYQTKSIPFVTLKFPY